MLRTNAGQLVEGGPTRFLRRREVEARTGLSTSGIYAAIARGDFPKPIAIGAQSRAWVESEIIAWQRARLAAAGRLREEA